MGINYISVRDNQDWIEVRGEGEKWADWRNVQRVKPVVGEGKQDAWVFSQVTDWAAGWILVK